MEIKRPSTRRRRGRNLRHITEVNVGAGKTATIRLRLSDPAPAAMGDPFKKFAETMQIRQREADLFYASITPNVSAKIGLSSCARPLPGCSGRKQFFFFDVDLWLVEHGRDPMNPGTHSMRNSEWFHMINEHIISMPDKWEYPWYAAWDLAFHCVALSTVDTDFAKEQLDLMLQEFFLHPTGQIPAYEWNFSDVDPPVHAWATISFIEQTRLLKGRGTSNSSSARLPS